MGNAYELRSYATNSEEIDLGAHVSKSLQSCQCKVYLRALIRDEIYHCVNYLRASKQNSYTVMYNTQHANTNYGEIQYFVAIQWKETEQVICAVIKPLLISALEPKFSTFDSVQKYVTERIVHIDSELSSTSTSKTIIVDIVCKCIEIKLGSNVYVARFPNTVYGILN